MSPPVVIVGAGMSGLSCARRLVEKRIGCLILDASDAVGGRVRTDFVDGFRLDRGFQVLVDSYPQTADLLKGLRLDLRRFDAGARVWTGDRFHAVYDPLRHPTAALRSAFTPLLTVGDKFKLTRLWTRVLTADSASLLASGPDQTTDEYWSSLGLSTKAVESFLRPFFGGVCLQHQLTTSARFFRYMFKQFATGRAVVPAKGMQQIPETIADALRADGVSIRLGSSVATVEPRRVVLTTGEAIDAAAVVLAVDLSTAQKLLRLAGTPPGEFRTSRTVYFAADTPVIGRPTLVLNGVGRADGPVNSLAEMSAVSPDYAPPGQTLVSVSVVDVAADVGPILAQMRRWLGATVDRWRHLRTYKIAEALPPADPPFRSDRPVKTEAGIYLCGDHRDHPSIEGAVTSGRRAADAVISLVVKS